jgi:hypothetical protein
LYQAGGKTATSQVDCGLLFNNGHHAGAMLTTDFTIPFKLGMGEQGR